MRPTRLEPVAVREFEVHAPEWPSTLDGLRIAHVSDFHFRKWNRVTKHAQILLGSLDYDLLLATGDFGNFHRHWQHAAEMTRAFFRPFAERAPVYAVLGNHDSPLLPTASDLPINFLRNESTSIKLRGRAVYVAGIEQVQPRGGDLQRTFSNVEPNTPTILMAHYPSTSFQLSDRQAHLVLSGHTHGGQIRIPGFGCLWPNDRIPRTMSSGLHVVNENHVHVSAGIGVSLPLRMRIHCPPELTIITMRSKETR